MDTAALRRSLDDTDSLVSALSYTRLMMGAVSLIAVSITVAASDRVPVMCIWRVVCLMCDEWCG